MSCTPSLEMPSHSQILLETMENGGLTIFAQHASSLTMFFLIVGFNWGVGQSELFGPPHEPPADSFMELDKKGWLGSMSRTIPFLESYLSKTELENIGQCNYCFFRSQSEGQISDEDLKRCAPIFDRFLEIARPSKVISFSSRFWNHLLDGNRVKQMSASPITFSRGNREIYYSAAKAIITIANDDVVIYKLPHPNYSMSQDGGVQAWGFCFGSVNPLGVENRVN